MPTPSTLTMISAATLAGNGMNQDHLVVTPRAVAVLDGATSWLPQDPTRDGGWYARTLGAALTTRLFDHEQPLPTIVAQAITETRDSYGLVPVECPTSTVAIARWDDASIELYALGDSPAVIYPTGSDPVVVLDDRLEPVGAEQRAAYRNRLAAGHGFSQTHAELIAALQRTERARRNRPGGYWIAESDPAAAHHAITATFPRAAVASLLLLSDGAAADVLVYHRHGWDAVPELLADIGLDTYLRNTHQAESEDGRGQRWPRAKRHDDKSLIKVTFD